MKTIALALVALTGSLYAQIPQMPQQLLMPSRRVSQPQGTQNGEVELLPANYQITLSFIEKEGQPLELSIITASSHVNASISDSNLSLNGALTIEDGGSLLFTNGLGWTTKSSPDPNPTYQSSSLLGSVRLKPGQEVQILRAGTRTARLTIKKVEGSDAPVKPQADAAPKIPAATTSETREEPERRRRFIQTNE